ncbi:hypothetical protein THRCLA_23482 [Thraustotheca clavata]|uniref:Thioredoxin domain-containing protein n=1 Tax=Thraustotheca clavata TaxID=74557 RepID=A0A1V9Y411_9STRA|nr:hypothetical protein THRCLA_23482 [Thraustotheca clavata]
MRSQPMSFLKLFRFSMAILLGTSVLYMLTMFRMSGPGEGNELSVGRLGASQSVANRRFEAGSFDEAKTFLESVSLSDGPVYIVLMSGKRDGEYWCGDCRNADKPISEAFAKAPSNARLLEVSVGEPAQWRQASNPFRIHRLFTVSRIPAVLEYKGNLKTSNLLLEKFAKDKELLEYLFQVNTKELKSSKIKDITTVDELQNVISNYDNSYPLFLFFISGNDQDTGRLWCPHCDSAAVPVEYYFLRYSPSNAIMFKVITSENYDAWMDSNNPFRQQNLVDVNGLPALFRAVPDSTPSLVFDEYAEYFEEREKLIQFYEKPL